MALSGSTLVVSAVTHASNGAIYVFTDSAGSWTYQTELVASDGRDNDYFGDKVATDGTTSWPGPPAQRHAGRRLWSSTVPVPAGPSGRTDGLRRRTRRLLRLGCRRLDQETVWWGRRRPTPTAVPPTSSPTTQPEVDPEARAEAH